MKADCYPVTSLPHISPLFRDFVSGKRELLSHFYSPLSFDRLWMLQATPIDGNRRQNVVSLLRAQDRSFGASPATESNLDRLAAGASAVVTGQQVTLFGGPLLTLLKAATAVRLAADASRAGTPHVPIFWLASEDHDFDEVNQITLPCGADTSQGLQTLRLPRHPNPGRPVGNLLLGNEILPLVEQLRRCLGEGPMADLISTLYTPDATLASAFAGLISRLFSDHGLIVIDASSRAFHAQAAPTLRAAIEHADDIHAALRMRTQELERAGYHAQVLVSDSSSLLFLIDEKSGVRNALKKTPKEAWSAGGRKLETAELISILETAPERISPNALLRPVMQDTLLPVSAYVGGPAEVAYYAQSQVVYQRILGHTTAIVPRFSATLVEPRLARFLHQHQLALPEVFTASDALAQRLGARSMPVDGKRKLAASGNALDRELLALTEWMHGQDAGLGHAADVAASKMLYQMNRLRRLAATHTLQRDERLKHHAQALCQALFPHHNLQERVLSGVYFLARLQPALLDSIIEHANEGDCGHWALEV